MSQRPHLHRLDAVKFVAAVMVVLIHASAYRVRTDTATFWNYEWYRHYLEIAVPLFFIASGYLLARKDARSVLRWVEKIAMLLLASTLLYVTFEIVKVGADRVFLDRGAREGLATLVGGWTMSAFMRGDLGQVQLWYLAAAALAGVIIAFLRHRGLSAAWILAIGTGVYAISLTGLVNLSPVAAYGGFPRALFYIALGIFLYSRRTEGSWRHLLVVAAAMTAYATLRIFDAGNSSELLIAVAALALGTYSVRQGTRATAFARLGRFALSIFILHMVFITSITRTLQYLDLDLSQVRDHVAYPFALTAVVTLLCIAAHRPFEMLVLEPVRALVEHLTAMLVGSARGGEASGQAGARETESLGTE